jgi:hypothetical protein
MVMHPENLETRKPYGVSHHWKDESGFHFFNGVERYGERFAPQRTRLHQANEDNIQEKHRTIDSAISRRQFDYIVN